MLSHSVYRQVIIDKVESPRQGKKKKIPPKTIQDKPWNKYSKMTSSNKSDFKIGVYDLSYISVH